jgi:two-component system LytT family response regulator
MTNRCVRAAPQLLASESSVRVIGTCANGREALAAVQRDSPDVVFLDVRMPDMDGLAFLKALPPAPKPLIIFVTGHAKHALKAFEVHAVDFLLKPFDRERLRAALHRALERSEASQPLDAPENIDALRLRLAPSPEGPDRIVVEKNGRIVFLKVDEIDWIAAATITPSSTRVRVHACCARL